MMSVKLKLRTAVAAGAILLAAGCSGQGGDSGDVPNPFGSTPLPAQTTHRPPGKIRELQQDLQAVGEYKAGGGGNTKQLASCVGAVQDYNKTAGTLKRAQLDAYDLEHHLSLGSSCPK